MLSEAEIATLWNNLELVACTRPVALAIRLLLATGQRRSEVARLHARELNPADRVWIMKAKDVRVLIENGDWIEVDEGDGDETLQE